jgi:hypothetical protein
MQPEEEHKVLDLQDSYEHGKQETKSKDNRKAQGI